MDPARPADGPAQRRVEGRRDEGEAEREQEEELRVAARAMPGLVGEHGLHLVFVESVEPGRVPPLEAVANRLRLEIEEQRRAANLEALLSDLRTRYSVRTAPEKPPARTGAMETG